MVLGLAYKVKFLCIFVWINNKVATAMEGQWAGGDGGWLWWWWKQPWCWRREGRTIQVKQVQVQEENKQEKCRKVNYLPKFSLQEMEADIFVFEKVLVREK